MCFGVYVLSLLSLSGKNCCNEGCELLEPKTKTKIKMKTKGREGKSARKCRRKLWWNGCIPLECENENENSQQRKWRGKLVLENSLENFKCSGYLCICMHICVCTFVAYCTFNAANGTLLVARCANEFTIRRVLHRSKQYVQVVETSNW